MELLLILKILMRRWWLVVVPVVIVGAVTVPDLLPGGEAIDGGYTTTFRYTAGQEREAFGAIDGDLQDVWEASFKLIEAFTAWARTSTFREEVARTANADGLTIAPAALAIAPDNQRAIGQITLNWPDADELVIIARAVIDVLQTRNADYFAPQLGGRAAEVILLDEPQIAPAPPPLTGRIVPLLQLALAVVAGVGLAFVAHYLDPAIHERDDVTRLGLPVVVSIPKR